MDFNNVRLFMNQGIADDAGLAREILSKVQPVYSDTDVEQPPLGPSVIYPPAVIEMLGEPSDWLEPM